jgi:hypothetical protein
LFLGGRWCRRRPKAPGLYPIAALDGAVTDPRKWKTIREDGTEVGVGFGEPGWQGWWWDRPVPPILTVPMGIVPPVQGELDFGE